MENKKLTEKEKKRLQLSPEEIENKQLMLFEEKSKLDNLEMQIISQEDSIENEVSLKQLEMQIAQVKSQIKLLPFMEKQLKEKTPLQGSRNVLKGLKKQMETTKSNIKVLTRQINTGMA